MMASINWGFWGAVIAVVAILIGAAVAIGIYLRSKATGVAVSATFDKTGLVHVLIRKKGTPTVHVRDVKLLQAGTNKTRPAGKGCANKQYCYWRQQSRVGVGGEPSRARSGKGVCRPPYGSRRDYYRP
jgi:hypothetical protein